MQHIQRNIHSNLLLFQNVNKINFQYSQWLHCSKYTYKIQTFSCFVKHDFMTIYRSIKDCFCSFRNAYNTQKWLLSLLFIAKENYSTTENLKWKFNHINSYGTKNYLQPIQWSLQSKLLLFQSFKKNKISVTSMTADESHSTIQNILTNKNTFHVL